MSDDFDAIVIGGGPAGSAAAILLAEAGWSVAVVERRTFPRRKVCGEYFSGTNWEVLRALGVEDEIRSAAGPEVRRVGLLAGSARLEAPLPSPGARGWGRALGRDILDTILARRAAAAGAAVLQPCSAGALRPDGERLICEAAPRGPGRPVELRAPVVIAAHGSWEPQTLRPGDPRPAPRPGDLIGFKAHLRGDALPADLMPLVAFPGGYGGMVRSDGGRLSLSACIRRDALAGLERGADGSAGAAVLAHILDVTPAARPVLDGAVLDGPWLSAGPIRPGIRGVYRDGLFAAGNAAGEAHPVVAEGISMALQSAWLLAGSLSSRPDRARSRESREAAAREYALLWRRSFVPRIRAAALVARWSASRAAMALSISILRAVPGLLTAGAVLSGKARRVAARVGLVPS
jgi:flavin-dependent dehydrogenase